MKRVVNKGFTIVELLIVVVVIAILAAITIVSYNGIQSRAQDTAVQSDLRNLLNIAGRYHAENGRYPSSVNQIENFKISKEMYATSPVVDFNFSGCLVANGTNFGAIAMSKSGKKYYFTSLEGGVKEQTSAGWHASSGAACTSIMATNSNYNGYLATDTSTGPWRAWVGGN